MLIRHFLNTFPKIRNRYWIVIAFALIVLSSAIIVNSIIIAPVSTPQPNRINISSANLPDKTKNKPTPSATQSTVFKKPTVKSPPQVNSGLFSIPILTYHYIAYNPRPQDVQRNALSVPPDKFEAQLDYLANNGYTPISMDTLYGIFNKQTTASAKPVVLTFDDGYQDFYSIVFPILSKYNFHAVSFIPTGLIGGSYYMNWRQIKEIQASGLVTFEDHTVSHANLASLSYDDTLKQMIDSKNELFAKTGYPVNFIAYPYGISDANVLSAAQKAGFIGGVGTWYSKATGPGFNMPRIKVSGYWSINEFASRL